LLVFRKLVNQLHLFPVNIKEYHWLNQPTNHTPNRGLSHYGVNGTILTVPLPIGRCITVVRRHHHNYARATITTTSHQGAGYTRSKRVPMVEVLENTYVALLFAK